ncbi:YesL family protein [Gracilibacillus dipsosauri]
MKVKLGEFMMELTGIWASLYKVCTWVTRFAWLNLIWLLGTLIGLILFGLMPATIAMFTIVRKWIQKETDTPILSTFVDAFKSHFWKANLFGVVLYGLGYFLSVFLKYAGLMSDTSFHSVLLGIFVMATFFYLMLVLYVVPVYVHFELSFWQYIRYAVTIGAIKLHYSICMVTILAGVYFLSFKFPGVGLFFSFSFSAYIIMFFAHLGFQQLLQVQQEQIDHSVTTN